MGGLVAQQQCVGPLQTPLADVAVVALSHQELIGAATALGEQHVKSLLDPKAAARLAVSEALTNLVFALVTDLRVSPPWLCPAVLGLCVHQPLSLFPTVFGTYTPKPSASLFPSNAMLASPLFPGCQVQWELDVGSQAPR